MGKQNDIQREADVIVDSICQKLYRKGANLRAELHKFSVARDGTTSKHELCKELEIRGISLSPDQLEALLIAYNKSGSDRIDFSQFRSACISHGHAQRRPLSRQSTSSAEEARSSFDQQQRLQEEAEPSPPTHHDTRPQEVAEVIEQAATSPIASTSISTSTPSPPTKAHATKKKILNLIHELRQKNPKTSSRGRPSSLRVAATQSET